MEGAKKKKKLKKGEVEPVSGGGGEVFICMYLHVLSLARAFSLLLYSRNTYTHAPGSGGGKESASKDSRSDRPRDKAGE